jgi:hypothetical protein
MHRVLADRKSMRLADCAVSRISRVRGTHHVAVAGNGVVTFQHLHNDRCRRHLLHELAVEWALLVHGVESPGLCRCHVQALLRDDAQANTLDHGIDRAGQVAARRIGLENGKGTLNGHGDILTLGKENARGPYPRATVPARFVERR